MLPGIDRVYVNERARNELGWRPRYDFRLILDRLQAGDDMQVHWLGWSARRVITPRFSVTGLIPWNNDRSEPGFPTSRHVCGSP